MMLSRAALVSTPIRQKILATASLSTMSFYSLSTVQNDGESISMEDFKGKVVYATNVASQWGATRREYARFETLNDRWGDNLVIMAFPSREFGNQEYASDEKILEFAKKKNFPGILMKLGKVLGDDAPEVWKFMKEESGASDPTWNFNGKFLVSKTGKVIVPTNVERDIEQLMEESWIIKLGVDFFPFCSNEVMTKQVADMFLKNSLTF